MGTITTNPDDSTGINSPTNVKISNQNGLSDPWYQNKTVWVVAGVLAGIILFTIFIIIIFIIVSKKRQNMKKAWDLGYNESDCIVESKSAPISRNPSPKLAKRKSCPDVTTASRDVMIRSMTVESVPNFTLPPERVQPCYPHERSHSASALQYQQKLLGHLQPDLYKSSSFSDEEGLYLPPSENGRLWFSVLYDVAVEQFNVTLIKVRELPGRGRNNAQRDPFVKIFLLPDERACRVSKVRKKTLSPIYNESFVFQVSPKELQDRILRFSVYDVDKRRIRYCLGHVLVPLADVDLTKGEPLYRDLEVNSQVCSALGEINIGLTYLPNMDKVKVVVLSGRNLRQVDIDQNNSVFMRVQMLHGRKVCKSKKTMQHRASTDPVFNESFSFSISGKVLDTCSFEIAVMTTTKTPLSHDELYGKVVIGSFMFARGEELLHWQEMLSQPRKTITKWHSLNSTPHHE